MIYVFDEHGRCVGIAFREAPPAPPTKTAHVFDDRGRLIGYFEA